MPLVSIITPTKNRANLLPAIWDCVRAQSMKDFEWLVLDDSPERARMFNDIDDRRVRYKHVKHEMTIGAKRNDLCQAAAGEIVVMFDDDDFYAPHYVAQMLSLMRESGADFVKLFGFFIYHRQQDIFAYWNLAARFPVQYRVGSNQVMAVPYNPGDGDLRLGFGFSYVFRRQVWGPLVCFADENWNEDGVFAQAAAARFKFDGMQDTNYSCLHVIHDSNSSTTYPQQLLDRSLIPNLFPAFPKR